MKPQVGQLIKLYNDRHLGRITKVYPAGTLDAVDKDGKTYRVTGLPFP